MLLYDKWLKKKTLFNEPVKQGLNKGSESYFFIGALNAFNFWMVSLTSFKL